HLQSKGINDAPSSPSPIHLHTESSYHLASHTGTHAHPMATQPQSLSTTPHLAAQPNSPIFPMATYSPLPIGDTTTNPTNNPWLHIANHYHHYPNEIPHMAPAISPLTLDPKGYTTTTLTHIPSPITYMAPVAMPPLPKVYTNHTLAPIKIPPITQCSPISHYMPHHTPYPYTTYPMPGCGTYIPLYHFSTIPYAPQLQQDVANIPYLPHTHIPRIPIQYPIYPTLCATMPHDGALSTIPHHIQISPTTQWSQSMVPVDQQPLPYTTPISLSQPNLKTKYKTNSMVNPIP
ncbi:hypothetical protein G9A89_000237, partial [Geosiphon pyriformis]